METLTVDILLRIRANIDEEDWKALQCVSREWRNRVRDSNNLLRPSFATHTCMLHMYLLIG